MKIFKFVKKNSGGPDPDQEMIDLRMNAIKHKILVLSGKGGEITQDT